MTTMHNSNDWRIKVRGMEPHTTPHVHVEFNDGYRCSVRISDGLLLSGGVSPKKRIKPALEWIASNRVKLIDEYERLNRNEKTATN